MEEELTFEGAAMGCIMFELALEGAAHHGRDGLAAGVVHGCCSGAVG